MIGIAVTLLPVFGLILTGCGLRRMGALGPGFWSGAEWLAYHMLLPALIVDTLARQAPPVATGLGVGAALMGAVLVVAGGLSGARWAGGVGGARFGDVLQGAIRPNTYVGLAAATAVFGDHGRALAVVGVGVTVPLVNVLSVIALSTTAAVADRRAMVRALVTNPLLVATAVGAGAAALGAGLPPVIGPMLGILGRAALPIGLLAVGAGLDLAAARAAGGAVALASGLKLVVLPGVAVAVALGLGLPARSVAVVALFAALPCAVASYVLSRQLGGDPRLMAAIISIETVAALVTMPVVVGAVVALV